MNKLFRGIGLVAAIGLAACGADDDTSQGALSAQPASGGAAGVGGIGGAAGDEGQAGSAGQAGTGGAGGTAGEGGSGGEGGQGGSGGIASTHGEGGLNCSPSTTKYDGQPYCLATVGDIELKLFAPQNPVGPMQIAVYLHGDTANGYYGDWGYEALSAWAWTEHVL